MKEKIKQDMLLGLDIGTTGVRALIIDADGNICGSAIRKAASISSVRPGWAEQSPDDWWRAACEAVPSALHSAGVSASEIDGIGLAGQMHSLVLLDPSGVCLRDAMLWCDQRTERECQSITEVIGSQRLIQLTANPAITGFTLPKLEWVRTHEPNIWKRVHTISLPKDYVRFRLTNTFATDVSDASGTLLFDVCNRHWLKGVLEAVRIAAEMLPPVFESHEVVAYVSRRGAAECSLREGIPVVAGAGDQAAGAVGMGTIKPGDVSATIGTSGVVFGVTSGPISDPLGRIHTFCHALPNRWHVIGGDAVSGVFSAMVSQPTHEQEHHV